MVPRQREPWQRARRRQARREPLIDSQLVGLAINDNDTHLELETLRRELFCGAANDFGLTQRGLDHGTETPGGNLSNRRLESEAHVSTRSCRRPCFGPLPPAPRTADEAAVTRHH